MPASVFLLLFPAMIGMVWASQDSNFLTTTTTSTLPEYERHVMVGDVNELCQASYGNSVRMYHWTVVASVLLALFCLSLRHLCLRDLIGAPTLAAQFYTVIATLQLVIAGIELTAFLPHCPDPCIVLEHCNNHYKPAYFVYPVCATALALLLYREAAFHAGKAQQMMGMRTTSTTTMSSDHDDSYQSAIMFHRIPEMEMQDQI